MFPIIVAILSILTIAAGLFALGIIAIPAPGIAMMLFMGFAFLLGIELALGRKPFSGVH
jgi:hypothetical protein